ncbi:MAG TPA: hypothetical protein VGB54_03230 [Allosphingosinicella sp.]|jgi:hypothetical protein
MTSNDGKWEDFLRRTEAPARDEGFILALIERIEKEHAARARLRSVAVALLTLAAAASLLVLPRAEYGDELALFADCLVALLIGVAFAELLGRLPGGPALARASGP